MSCEDGQHTIGGTPGKTTRQEQTVSEKMPQRGETAQEPAFRVSVAEPVKDYPACVLCHKDYVASLSLSPAIFGQGLISASTIDSRSYVESQSLF